MRMPAGGVAAVLGAVTLGLGVVGCGGDDAAGGGGSGLTTTVPATTTTQPPATDAEAVRPVIEELVHDYDAALAAVVVDPGQVDDPASPVLEDLEAVLTQTELEQRLVVYRENAAEGRVFEPIGSKPLRVTVLAGDIVAHGDDALEVPVCTIHHYRKRGPDGVEEKDGFPHPGRIEAERVEGTWKISWSDEDPLGFCDPAVAVEAAG